MTTPASEREAGSDEPTGRLCFGKVGPSSGLLGGSVRTSFSNADGLRFCPPSYSSRSRSSSSRWAWASSSRRPCRSPSTRSRRSSSRTISRSRSTGPTALAVRKRRRAPTAAATRAEATPCGSTRPAEPHPEGRHRERGKPQWRLNVSLSTYWFAVDGGCAELTPLYSILPATPPCGVSDGDGWRLSRSTYRIGVSR